MHVKSANNFRENLRTAITARGMSQRGFAEKSHISHPYINRVLAGKVQPSLEMCDQMADSLNFTLAEMLRSPAAFSRSIEQVTQK